MEDNRKSRRIANDIKFLNDKKVSYGRSRSDIDFYNFGLEITKSLEPELFNSIECVSSRLFINIENIKTFVYPSESIQAECWAFEELCLIRISSTVLDVLLLLSCIFQLVESAVFFCIIQAGLNPV